MNTLKEQDGRYYQEAEVVMIATKEKSHLILDHISGKLAVYSRALSKEHEFTTEHLYITSNEEIKERDWVLDGLTPLAPTELLQVTKEDLERCIENYHYGSCKKIISTTDESLLLYGRLDKNITRPLPKPSDSFISKYIEEYNKGQQITNVLVEYEDIWTKPQGDELLPGFKVEYALKVDSNNTITIKKVKDSYSREEVEQLIHKAFKAGYERSHSGYPHTDNWTKPKVEQFIKENL